METALREFPELSKEIRQKVVTLSCPWRRAIKSLAKHFVPMQFSPVSVPLSLAGGLSVLFRNL